MKYLPILFGFDANTGLAPWVFVVMASCIVVGFLIGVVVAFKLKTHIAWKFSVLLAFTALGYAMAFVLFGVTFMFLGILSGGDFL